MTFCFYRTIPSPGIKTLKIPLGKDNDGNDYYYWVEYRKSLGVFDKEDVVQIRTKPTSLYTGSELSYNSLRFKKSTNSGDYLNIDSNESFYDLYRGIKIELIEETGGGSESKATLKVNLAPLVTTGSALNLESDSATLKGTVNPYGEETTVWFEYGTTSGLYTNATSVQIVSKSGEITVSSDIVGLSEETTYYYRTVAQNSMGIVYGNEKKFILITVIPKVSVGAWHNLVLTSSGMVWAWGGNWSGQLGDNTTTDRTTPIQVNNLSGITAISGGGEHSLALKSDGTVWAWGNNWAGQLGDGTTTYRTIPVQVSGINNVTAISAGYYYSIALKSDGTVWTWGENYWGQLGDGTNFNKTTPVQVSKLSNITAIAAGDDHVIALESDRTVWTWGRNGEGQLGDDTNTNRNTPVQLIGLNDVSAIAGGQAHSLVLKSDGTVWTWGDNGIGQLGDSTTNDRATPINVVNFSNTIDIDGGAGHTVALKSNGTVWTCGAYGWVNNGNGWSYCGTGLYRNRLQKLVVLLLLALDTFILSPLSQMEQSGRGDTMKMVNYS